ncbi:MAG: MBL fold metallo-hydrolase [Desulfovibrionaceae bacterium]|nr:MBL fold metallo-hydrolase [Desulfovibrionaceae bacterium]
MEPLRITLLMDNDAKDGLACEHGLSMFLQTPAGAAVLWDFGASGAFLDNARALGVDLSRLEAAALSHGHYDHAGGLGPFLEATGFSGPVYGHPACASPRWSVRAGSAVRDISAHLPAGLELVPVRREERIVEGLTMLADVERLPGRAQMVEGFHQDPEGAVADTVPDDGCLLAESPGGPVLVLGCCHSGLANTLAAVRARLGVDRLHAVVGGLHLKGWPDIVSAAVLDETLEALVEFGVERVCAGHCTGHGAARALLHRATAARAPFHMEATPAGTELVFA